MAYHHHEYRSPFGDTTYTKVFVGGLAWETPTERMRDYFQQFGEILEAVIITDKNTGKSKGYGFVTFRDAESASRACQNANPMIDGRRANCNIASFGRPTTSHSGGTGQGAPSSPPPLLAQLPTGAMQGMPPHPAANPFFYQSSYGYTPYTPGCGYYQAMYNAHYQQAQYYPQLYGSSVSSSMSNQYGYGYPFQGSRAPFYPASAHRIPGSSYMHYAASAQMEGPSCDPYSPGVAAASTTLNLSNVTSLQNPPSIRQQSSFSSDSQLQERTSAKTEAVVVTSGGSSSPFD